MLQISLNAEDSELLHRILASYLSDLRVEIAGTDLEGFKESLRSEEQLIKRLLRQIEDEAPASPEIRSGEYA
jgi:hypothetical protein